VASAASGTGLGNYTISYHDGTLTVDRAPLTITAADKTKIYGEANPVLTGTTIGIKNSDPISASYSTAALQTSAVGSYSIIPAAVDGTPSKLANYQVTLVNGTLKILYRWDGFLQPINDTAHQTGLYESKFKLGQTIPAKFEIKDALGNVIQQVGNPTFTRSANLGNCDATATLETVPVVAADAAAEYKLTGSQYLYGWSTKNLTSGEYRIYANLADGTARSVDICLTK
jgi:hypothetical protein